MTDTRKSDADTLRAWASENLDRAVHELMDAGKLAGISIEARPAWAMSDKFVIGQVRDNASAGGFLWIIAGAFETDSVGSNVAATARDAARHFSLKWQLDAEKSPDDRDDIVRRAEELYAIVETDDAWRAV